MNILFNSRDAADKSPFGTIRAGEPCRLRLRIPSDCGAYRVILTADGLTAELELRKTVAFNHRTDLLRGEGRYPRGDFIH